MPRLLKLDITNCPTCKLPVDDHYVYVDRALDWRGCAYAEQLAHDKLEWLYTEHLRRSREATALQDKETTWTSKQASVCG
jgi:hypothetical protein